MLLPILALIAWTMIMWMWMYVTRIPAMSQLKIAPQDNPRGLKGVLPASVEQIADNYNHLHEQPTLFYALALTAHVGNLADGVAIWLAWGYVGLRVLHSLVQATINLVVLRFAVFALASLVLIALCAKTILEALGG
jgi:hypothetical protein